MKNLREWFYPQKVEEAVAILREWGDKAMPLAGGTGAYYLRHQPVEALVDISRIGLDHIAQEQDSLRLGALLSAETIAHHPAPNLPPFRALAEAAFAVGSLSIRNGVTLGGNIARVYPWSNLPLPLLVLEALVLITERPQPLPASLFFQQPPHRLLEPGELITEIRLPLPSQRAGSSFLKFARTATDYSLASVAASLLLDEEGRCAQARIAVGAVLPLPRRIEAAEELLLHQPLNETLLQQAAQQVAQEIQPTPDQRASVPYRTELLETLTRRALAQAWQRAQEETPLTREVSP